MYEEQKALAGGQAAIPDVHTRLKMRKKSLEKQMKEVNEAIELFEQYPEMAKALTLVRTIL